MIDDIRLYLGHTASMPSGFFCNYLQHLDDFRKASVPRKNSRGTAS